MIELRFFGQISKLNYRVFSKKIQNENMISKAHSMNVWKELDDFFTVFEAFRKNQELFVLSSITNEWLIISTELHI